MKIAEKYRDRFKRRVLVTAGCWLWQAGKSSAGYGRMSVNGKPIYAHRRSFLLHCGDIPEEMDILHRCDNPACVNPEHLFLGTHADNMRDRDIKGRGRTCNGKTRGERHPLARLTKEDVINIRSDSRIHRVIGAEYGISRRHVGEIKQGKYWKCI